jgi:hypothetical protein
VATPVCLLSHIPVLCACEFFDGDLATTGNWVVPGAWMHIDAGRLRELFLAHPNGLILVTGATGCGKSTTLAAMIDKINGERHDHILTIEDPTFRLATTARRDRPSSFLRKTRVKYRPRKRPPSR